MSTSQRRWIRRAHHVLLTLVVAFGTLASLAHAADPATGSGEFKSRGLTMPVASSVAYRGKSLLDKEDVVVVAISNSAFDLPWMAMFHDRSLMIEKRFVGGDTGVVYLEFRPDGSYKAHHFNFTSGNGCAYCAGNMGVTSTVKVANGRIAGTVKLKDDQKSADVKIDTPILSDDHGPALPAGGGDPGKAYMAYHDALISGVSAKVLPTVSKDKGKYIGQMMKDYKWEHPTRSVKIVRGWSKGDSALLLWEGESSTSKLVGEAVLVREGGRWVVDEELADVKMQ